MKICSRCHIEKEDYEFRVREDKRYTPVLIYLNNTCKICDAELQRDRVRKQRSTPDGKKRHNKWAKEFHKRHREEILKKMCERRKTPEYKAYMKEYRKKRKDIIYEQEVITKKRYHEKNRDNLTDRYAINLLRTQGYGASEEIEKDKEFIDLKKSQVLRKRIRLEILKKEKNGKKND